MARRTGTDERPRLPALDRDRIALEQHDLVMRALGPHVDPEERLRVVSELVDDATHEVERLRPQRDRLALSLSLYDGVRAIYNAIGMQRTRWYEVTNTALGVDSAGFRTSATREELVARAHARGIRYYKTAPALLPQVAERIVAAEERVKAGIPLRDDLARTLAARGVARPRLAELMRRNPSRVSHIKARTATPV